MCSGRLENKNSTQTEWKKNRTNKKRAHFRGLNYGSAHWFNKEHSDTHPKGGSRHFFILILSFSTWRSCKKILIKKNLETGTDVELERIFNLCSKKEKKCLLKALCESVYSFVFNWSPSGLNLTLEKNKNRMSCCDYFFYLGRYIQTVGAKRLDVWKSCGVCSTLNLIIKAKWNVVWAALVC